MKRILTLLIILLFSVSGYSTVIVVTSVNDDGTGSLRQAIAAANLLGGLDTIRFHSSIDGQTINITSGQINITDDIDIQGNGTSNTVIQGAAGKATFNVAANKNTSFSKIRMMIGQEGIKSNNPSGHMFVQDCEFTGFSYYAVYFYSNYANLVVDRCYIHDNGNGVWTQNSMDYTVTNSTFVNNYTSGAILMAGGFMGNGYFKNNTLHKNNYGIWIISPVNGKKAEIVNNTVIGSTNNGIYVNDYGNAPSVYIANNISYGNGTDINVWNDFSPSANPVFRNNIVKKCYSSYGCPTFYSSADPQLLSAAPEDNGGPVLTFAINCNSPAFNSGNDTGSTVNDARGMSRGMNPDIGAYEFHPSMGNMSTTSCFSYESPSGKYVWTESGNYYDTISSSAGCDSIVSIALDIKTVNTMVEQNGRTLTSKALVSAYQWLNCNNYSAISGEINQSFTAQASGDYAVEVTTDGCTDTSDCVNVDLSGIWDEQLNDLEIFPNPAQDKITFSSNGSFSDELTISILSIDGVVVRTIKTDSQELYIGDLNPGNYILTVESDSYFSVVKLVKSGN